jgi:hypothetical protein
MKGEGRKINEGIFSHERPSKLDLGDLGTVPIEENNLPLA